MDRNKFKTVISNENKMLNLHLKETFFDYKDLIVLFVKKEFVANYKQTILGPLWAIIQPLLTTVVFTVVFSGLAGLTTADTPGEYQIPAFLFYMAGNICWSYFSTTLQETSNTFITNSATMGKVYYPRLVAPVSTAFSKLISFVIQFAIFLGIWLVYIILGTTSIVVTPKLLLIPLCVLEMMILSVGFGLIISSVTTKYRDLKMLIAFGLQLWQYGSPIAYGLQLIPEQFMPIYMLNPVTPIIVTFRYAMFGFGYWNLGYYLIGWAVSLICFFVGLVLFSRIERTFMDTV